MKRMHFLYQMQLAFSQAVHDHHFLIRCIPMEDGIQKREHFSCRITPADTLDQVADGFGNQGYAGAVRGPHDGLSVQAQGIVRICGTDRREPLHPVYRFPSAYTVPGETIRRFLDETGQEFGRQPVDLAGLTFLMHRLAGRFSYVPGVTSVKTRAEEALAGGQGVCQDYAHIFISLCRLAGVPARYVAGMITGEGQTHAWAEAWLDGVWHGFDPTNSRMADETYIRLTHGRDFADGAVDKGCFLGFASQTQQILVKVEETA